MQAITLICQPHQYTMSPALLIHLARRDLTDRFSGSALGAGWVLVQPLVMVFIFTVIFAHIMAARLPGNNSAWGFGIYLMSGMLPWTAFSMSCLRCCTVFSDRKPMIQQMQTSLPQLPIYILLAETFTYVVTTVILVVMTVISGDFAGWPLLALIPVFLAQLLITYGSCLLLATFSVFLPDIKEVTGIVFQLWFWFTPIVYLADIIPASIRPFMLANPALPVIECYHAIFVRHQAPETMTVLIMLMVGLTLSSFAYVILRRLERDVRDFL